MVPHSSSLQVFINNVNALFLSNSQRGVERQVGVWGVYQ